MAQFRMGHAVEQDQIDALRRRCCSVDNFVERTAVLALEIDFGRRSRRVEAGDFRKSCNARDGRGHVDLAGVQLEQSAAHAWTAEDQRRAALHDVERAMLPRLDSPGVGLGADDDIGRARAIEQWVIRS